MADQVAGRLMEEEIGSSDSSVATMRKKRRRTLVAAPSATLSQSSPTATSPTTQAHGVELDLDEAPHVLDRRLYRQENVARSIEKYIYWIQNNPAAATPRDLGGKRPEEAKRLGRDRPLPPQILPAEYRANPFGAGGEWTEITAKTIGASIIPTAAHKRIRRYRECHLQPQQVEAMLRAAEAGRKPKERPSWIGPRANVIDYGVVDAVYDERLKSISVKEALANRLVQGIEKRFKSHRRPECNFVKRTLETDVLGEFIAVQNAKKVEKMHERSRSQRDRRYVPPPGDEQPHREKRHFSSTITPADTNDNIHVDSRRRSSALEALTLAFTKASAAASSFAPTSLPPETPHSGASGAKANTVATVKSVGTSDSEDTGNTDSTNDSSVERVLPFLAEAAKKQRRSLKRHRTALKKANVKRGSNRSTQRLPVLAEHEEYVDTRRTSSHDRSLKKVDRGGSTESRTSEVHKRDNGPPDDISVSSLGSEDSMDALSPEDDHNDSGKLATTRYSGMFPDVLNGKAKGGGAAPESEGGVSVVESLDKIYARSYASLNMFDTSADMYDRGGTLMYIWRALRKEHQDVVADELVLLHGVETGSVQMVKRALKLRVPVDTAFEGKTGFHICFANILKLDAGEPLRVVQPWDRNDTVDHEKVLHLLRRAGADINLPIVGTGWRAIHMAAEANNLKRTVQLMDAGADFEARTLRQETPLIVAAQNRNFQFVKHMYFKGADIDATDELGNTALHYAAQVGSQSITELWLQCGANRDARNKAGQVAIDLVPEHLPGLRYAIRIFKQNEYGAMMLCRYLDQQVKNVKAEGAVNPHEASGARRASFLLDLLRGKRDGFMQEERLRQLAHTSAQALATVRAGVAAAVTSVFGGTSSAFRPRATGKEAGNIAVTSAKDALVYERTQVQAF